MHPTQEQPMVSPSQPSLHEVDWSKIPAPEDDGAARHLAGLAAPDVVLAATDGTGVSLARVPGRAVVFAYPRTGVPGQNSPVPDWDMIPGARGCTPQACAYRDLHKELTQAGAARVFGLSTQDTAYQREAAERLHLPFPLLSDEKLALAKALRLPLMEVGGTILIKRLAMVLDDGRIAKVFYPVFPPDRSAADVLAWLQEDRRP
jgi:peroxiredoxin (alkyl hydroperoxide reductase subunit C)